MTFHEWLNRAIYYLNNHIPPHCAAWDQSQQRDLFAGPEQDIRQPLSRGMVDPKFLAIADLVLCHRDTSRFGMLYNVLWRLTHGEPKLLSMDVDSQMQKVFAMRKAVMSDIHRMQSFVRFKHVCMDGDDAYVAWYEPDHYVVQKTACFFKERFANMRWVILTPVGSLLWNKKRLQIGEGAAQKPPLDDTYDDLWRTYYASTFNPSRTNQKLLTTHMPVRFWKNLPEADIISTLLK